MDPKTTVDVVKGSIDAADKALDLYNKVLDQVIPWDSFEKAMKELTRYQNDYSKEAAALVGEIKTLLMNSLDKYFEATQNIYEWCGISSQLLTAYLTLFEQYDEKKAAVQKDILLEVLGSGLTKMTAAQTSLQSSSESFNTASGKLLALETQLSNDFNEKSVFFENQVSKLRKEAYGGAAAGIAAGLFGLIISYSIAAGVLEGKLIPELTKKLKSVQAFFTNIKNEVTKANQDINTTKAKLAEEISVIGDMKITTETTQFYVKYDDLMLSLLKDSANSLILQCNDYQKRHGKKS